MKEVKHFPRSWLNPLHMYYAKPQNGITLRVHPCSTDHR